MRHDLARDSFHHVEILLDGKKHAGNAGDANRLQSLQLRNNIRWGARGQKEINNLLGYVFRLRPTNSLRPVRIVVIENCLELREETRVVRLDTMTQVFCRLVVAPQDLV